MSLLQMAQDSLRKDAQNNLSQMQEKRKKHGLLSRVQEVLANDKSTFPREAKTYVRKHNRSLLRRALQILYREEQFGTKTKPATSEATAPTEKLVASPDNESTSSNSLTEIVENLQKILSQFMAPYLDPEVIKELLKKVPLPPNMPPQAEMSAPNMPTSQAGMPAPNMPTSQAGMSAPNMPTSQAEMSAPNMPTPQPGMPAPNMTTSQAGMPAPNMTTSQAGMPAPNMTTSQAEMPAPNMTQQFSDFAPENFAHEQDWQRVQPAYQQEAFSPQRHLSRASRIHPPHYAPMPAERHAAQNFDSEDLHGGAEQDSEPQTLTDEVTPDEESVAPKVARDKEPVEKQPMPVQEIKGILELKPPEPEDAPYLTLTYDFNKIPHNFALSHDHNILEYAYYKYKPMLIKAQNFIRRKQIAHGLNYYRTIRQQNIPDELKTMIDKNIDDINDFLYKYLMSSWEE